MTRRPPLLRRRDCFDDDDDDDEDELAAWPAAGDEAGHAVRPGSPGVPGAADVMTTAIGKADGKGTTEEDEAPAAAEAAAARREERWCLPPIFRCRRIG